VARRTAGDFDENRLAHHFEWRPVNVPGLRFAVSEDRFQHGRLCGRQIVRAADAPEGERVWPGSRVASPPREAGKLFLRFREAARLDQRLELYVAQGDEIVRVEPRVIDLLGRQ